MKSQCYGRANDLAKSILLEKLNSDSGVHSECDYKIEPLSVVSEGFTDFNGLLSTRRHTSEKIKDFESRFSAKLSQFKAHGTQVESRTPCWH